MICQQYISKVKGWSGPPPPRPSASPGAPHLKAGEEASFSLLVFLPSLVILEAAWNLGLEPTCLGFNLRFSTF